MLQLVAQILLLEVAILLLLRPILLWYLKINQGLMLLRSIDSSLKCLPAVKERNARLRRAS